jgi:molecular chaperone DnaJ
MSAKGKLGDVVITVEIAVPQKLSKTAKAALQDFAKATEDEHPRTEFLERAASAPRISVED